MQNGGSIFFSIVIPTRNESEDILTTLDSIRKNTFESYEVLVVDASKDNTPEIVKNYPDSRVRLISQDNRDGRCGARNQGIRSAVGEVVVILNADVRLPTDFLERIKRHYDKGADYVIVNSAVENVDHPFGALIQGEHAYFYESGREVVNWCEGYSCRRQCAIDAGLFPEKLPLAVCAGEDAHFGDNIAKRFKRVEDMSILVKHAVPEDFKTFWDQRVGRGQGCVQRLVLLDGWTMSHAFVDGCKWTLKSILWICLLFPMFSYTWKLSKLIRQPLTKIIIPVFISRFTHEIGRWKGFFQVYRSKRLLASQAQPVAT